jgi:arylsulfatase A-like enzyme
MKRILTAALAAIILCGPALADDKKSAGSYEDPALWRAPFLMRVPPQRRVIRWARGPVRPQDAAPTVLDLLGVPAPETMEGWALSQGEQDVPELEETAAYAETAVEGGPRGAAARYVVERDASGRPYRRLDPVSEDRTLLWKKRMIEVEGKRLIYVPAPDGVKFELYDLAADPDAKTDIAGKPAAAADLEKMKDIFFRVLSREEGWRPQNDFWIPEAQLREEAQ